MRPRALAPLLLALAGGCDFFELPAVEPQRQSVVLAPPGGLTTSEAGDSATFTVRLALQPSADVTIPVASSDPSEGTVSPASLTFTPATWSAPQTVTVTGVGDDLADGARQYEVRLGSAQSADAAFSGVDPPDVSVTNVDDDSPGVVVTPTSGLTTREDGGGASFTIRLASRPTASVTIGLASSDPGEGTVAPASVTFTSESWSTPQTATVTGVDDDLADGPRPYAIVTAPAASADPGYAAVDASDVAVTNLDDESAGVVVSPTSGLGTSEGGDTATFTIRLGSRPTASVTIALSSSDPTEGTVSPPSVTFTPATWDAARTVTVTGVDDAVDDGDQAYSLVTEAATSADPAYDGLAVPDVSVTNADDDAPAPAPGFTVTPTSGLTTTEAGGQDTFTVRLTSQPSAPVTIAVASLGDEGAVDVASLTFTAATWDVPQIVTVTGLPDAVADGDQQYTIQLAPAVSGDPDYSGSNPPDVTVTNLDVP